MSKKQLLTESEIRRFMKLANLEPLTKNVLSEESQAVARIQGDPAATSLVQPQSEAMMNYDEADETPADDMGDEPAAGGEEEIEVDMEEGGGDLMELLEMLKSMLKPEFAEQLDIQAGDDEGEGEDMAGPPEDMGGEEEESGEVEELEEKKKAHKETTAAKHKETAAESSAAKKTKKESLELSEDGLVEAILARVTARLMQEAKKKKMSAKEKMEKKKKEADKKKKMMEEATDAKNGGPLLSKGGNKHDTYKGHADMEYGKGEKGGKGGHAMEKVTAKAEHTVTHGGKNLATLGGNKS